MEETTVDTNLIPVKFISVETGHVAVEHGKVISYNCDQLKESNIRFLGYNNDDQKIWIEKDPFTERIYQDNVEFDANIIPIATAIIEGATLQVRELDEQMKREQEMIEKMTRELGTQQ